MPRHRRKRHPVPISGLMRSTYRTSGILSTFGFPSNQARRFLVGENNAGKSSFLLAIAAACGSHRVTRDDLHQSDEGTSTEATVDLIIRSAGVEFTEAVAQRLSGNYGNGPGPGEWTAIRTD